jgi:predicted secreted hydrolase
MNPLRPSSGAWEAANRRQRSRFARFARDLSPSRRHEAARTDDPPRSASTLPLLLALALVVAGCTAGGGEPILANAPAPIPSPPAATDPPVTVVDPLPVVLPRDDGPHDRLTEWWYYTGHLEATTGQRLGFEYVIFRAERGSFPTTWASHLAITDETGDAFHYGQRLEVGEAVDRSPRDADGATTGFDLSLAGTNPADPRTFDQPPWTMAGSDGSDRLNATMSAAEATLAGAPGGLGLDLALRSRKTPALHDTDGWIDFGPAGSSYYYSRTAMEASGTVTLDGTTLTVAGIAWFDHQWGDFVSVGGGGWDWFAVNLEDGTDLTASLVRDADGSYPLIYATVVDASGATRHLNREDFTVEVTDRWISPATGADYPAGWTIAIPGDDLVIELEPTVAEQELDTRATTGVVYWEGSQLVRATRSGQPLGGAAYVELTGYAPSTGATP